MTAETDRRAMRAGMARLAVGDILALEKQKREQAGPGGWPTQDERALTFTRTVPVEDIVISRNDRTGRTVEAYAAVFMTPAEIVDQDGHYREQNAPDAFNKSVAERQGQVFCVYNHARALGGMPSDMWSVPLGEVLWIRADSRGLLTATRYSDDPASDRILTAIRNKALKGMSYTGVFLRSEPELTSPYDEYRPDKDGNLTLVTRLEIALIEFGPTPIPAYTEAEIIGVRAKAVDRPVPQKDPSVKANVVSSNPDGPAPYVKRDNDTIECPNCGLFTDTGSKFCDQCGEGLGPGSSPTSADSHGYSTSPTDDTVSSGVYDAGYQEGPDDHVQCPSCGRFNGPDAIFCRDCGASIPSSAYAAAENGATPPLGPKVSSSGRKDEEGQERSDAEDEDDERARAAGQGGDQLGPTAGKILLPSLDHPEYQGLHTHAHRSYGAWDDDGDGIHAHEHAHDGNDAHDHGHEDEDLDEDGDMRSQTEDDAHERDAADVLTEAGMTSEEAAAFVDGHETEADEEHERSADGEESTEDEAPVVETHHTRAGGVDDSSWDGSAALASAGSSPNPASAFSAICAGRRSGDPKERQTWALPHHKKPGAPPNAAGVRAALGRLGQTQGLTNASAAKSHLEAHSRAIQKAHGTSSSDTSSTSSSGRDPAADLATSRNGAGTGTEQPVATSAEPHAHPAPPPSTRSDPMAGTDDRMTIAERIQRQADVRQRLTEIDEEFMGSELSYDRAQEWKQLQQELIVHERAIHDASQRQEYLRGIAEGSPTETPTNGAGLTERVDDGRTGYQAATWNRGGGIAGMAGSTGPQFSPRGNAIYDLTAIRNRARSVDEVPTLYREYACRAIEAARFPGVSNREQAQTNVQRLIDSIDDEMGTLSRRILVTGSPLYERAFGKTLKALSTNGLSTEESRALQLGVDASGGFAVPFQLDPTVILTYNGVINPLRQISRVEQITGKEWDGVTSTGIVIARATEGQESSDNSPTLVAPTVRTTRVQGFVPFSIELDMSWGSMRNQMTQMLADAKDIEEAQSFTLGSGAAPNCNGLVTFLATAAPTNATVQVLTATTATVAVADIYNMESQAAPKFRQTSSWLASKTTYNRIRQLFQQFAALAGDPWVRALPGQPAELLGYPAFEASVMSNSIVSGQFPLIFGDFSQFLIVDRVGMGIELIPHLFGATNRFPTGQRGLFAIWFNNCQTLAANAFRIMQTR